MVMPEPTGTCGVWLLVPAGEVRLLSVRIGIFSLQGLQSLVLSASSTQFSKTAA